MSSRIGRMLSVQIFGESHGPAVGVTLDGLPAGLALDMDALSAFFCGLVVGACLLFGGKWLGSNSFLRTLVCSGIASLLSLLLVRAGLGSNVDLVTIGVLMLLVPGVALTNAMRELVAGDTYSGLSRTAEAILIAMGIALGSAVGLGIGQIL